MDPTPQRYEDPGGPLRPRLAVELQAHGLLEEFRLGARTLTWWYDVVGIAWVGHGEAELILADGSRLALPVDAELAPVTVAEVEQRVRAAHAAWRQPEVRSRCIAAWLAIDPDTPWYYESGSQTQLTGIAVLVLSTFAAAVIGPAAVIGIGAGFALVIAASFHSGCAWVARVDKLTWRSGSEMAEIDWADLRLASWQAADDTSAAMALRLVTDRTAIDVRGPVDTLKRLASAARRIANANAARFAAAGTQPIPDTALSPARLTSPEGDRGLSRTEAD